MSERMHERVYQWMHAVYISQKEHKTTVTWVAQFVAHLNVLEHISKPFDVGGGYFFQSYEEHPCDIVAPIVTYRRKVATRRTGAMLFKFANEDGSNPFEVLLVSTWDEDNDDLTLAAVPDAHMQQWLAFEEECIRVNGAVTPFDDEVYIVGGVDASFKTSVRWDDIHLNEMLKESIIEDVASFFEQGVDIYKRLNLKPFRKLLLAGVPGTGKTMLCGALANWALSRDYFVVYVSGSNMHGNEFWKIHEALEVAARAERKTIVIVEELDAYLQNHSKAQMLNVMDGSETPMNDHGTLLLSTTNHPEKIDDRVMKRPGRLDRIFIIPEVEDDWVALAMLKQYLGDLWREDHADVVPDLLGRPAAFIREVALYALTRTAYNQDTSLEVDVLRESLQSLIMQIESKDDFLTAHKQREMGTYGCEWAQ
jgi:archaellum biogenesis ATPase FlaH